MTSDKSRNVLPRVVSAILCTAVVAACSPSGKSANPPAANAQADAVAKIFADYDKADAPGCAVGVARDGEIIHTAAFGVADIEAKKPLTAQSVFNIASTSKQFTAFSILLLADRKQLKLDDPIVKYLPELAKSAKDVTISDLIHHMGGLRDYMTLLMLQGYDYTEPTTKEQTLEALARQQAPNSPPGVEFDYSNTGYFLLSNIIERVSGKSMKEFAAENIFKPLQMNDTSIVDHYPANIPALVRAYSPAEQGFNVDESTWEQTGDGQVHTTVSDLLRWSENYATGAVGGQALVQQMLETGVLKSGKRLDYAFGQGVGEYRGLPMHRHAGGWGGYRTELMRFPEQHLAVTVLCNRGDANPTKLAEEVADVYLPAAALQQPATQPAVIPSAPANSVELAKVALGNYRNAQTGRYIRLTRTGDQASVHFMGRDLPLQEVAPRVYSVGQLDGMWVAFGGGDPATLTLLSEDMPGEYTFTPDWTPAKLEAFAGTYDSPEAAAKLTLAVKDGVLTAQAGSESVALQPAGAEGEFHSDESMLQFSSSKQPKEFLYFTNGVRGLRFVRK